MIWFILSVYCIACYTVTLPILVTPEFRWWNILEYVLVPVIVPVVVLSIFVCLVKWLWI